MQKSQSARFAMQCVLDTVLAKLPQFDPIGIIPLALGRSIVTVLAFRTLQSDTYTHLEASSTLTLQKSPYESIIARPFMSRNHP